VGLYFNGKNLAVRNTCKTSDFATSILRINTSETILYDLHRRLIDFRRSAPYAEDFLRKVPRSISDRKIPTLKNGKFNRGHSSTLYEYVEPRNVTEFISSTSNSLPLIHVKVKSATLRLKTIYLSSCRG